MNLYVTVVWIVFRLVERDLYIFENIIVELEYSRGCQYTGLCTVAVPRHEVLAVVIYLAIYFATMLGNKLYEWYGHTKSSTNCKQYDSLKSKLFWVAHDVFSHTFVFCSKFLFLLPSMKSACYWSVAPRCTETLHRGKLDMYPHVSFMTSAFDWHQCHNMLYGPW